MPKHTLAHALVGILVMPGLIFAGYPDVPRSHWAAPAVDKVGQSGVMTSRSDGRFHGGDAATRYEVASAIARATAEMENRLVAEGHTPQDIVPYIERINLYVADEIDHLKQAQKELRATVNELLERVERREAHSTPLPPPCPPMSHPHVSPTPMAETQTRTEVHSSQRIHAVEGAAPVNAAPTAPQNKVARLRSRVSDGKIGAVEGAATVQPAAEAPEAPAAPIISDEAAWEKSAPAAPEQPEKPQRTSFKGPSKSALQQLKDEEMKVEDEAVAADETQPDIGWSDKDIEDAKAEVPKVELKPGKPAAKAPSVPKAKPAVTSAKPAPKAAPMPIGAGGIETTHGAVALPAANPFAGEHDASPAAAKAEAKGLAKPIKTASISTATPMEAAEILDTPDLAPTDNGPTDEQLSNWSGPKAAAPAMPAQAASAAKPSATALAAAPKQVFQRSAKATDLLEQLRSHRIAAK